MKEIKDKLVDKIMLLGAVYTIGVLLAGLLNLFRALRTIRILNWEHFPHKQDNLIVVSNHPSLVEPILLPALFFRDYILHPFRFSPWSTPDKSNYYDHWYWFWLRPRAIPIDREDKQTEVKAFFALKNILLSKGIVILFPEGGRTFKGEDFFYSKKGRRIRTLKKGVGLLIRKTNPLVLPVWVEGTENVLPNFPEPGKLYHTFPRIWKKIIIKIGKPIKFEGIKSSEEICQKLATILLNLADEEE